MTQFGSFTAYDAIGLREDLIDNIYRVAVEEVPIFSGIGRGNAKAVLHEWQTQALRAAATNSRLEGEQASVRPVTPTVRLTNYCQISDEVASISRTEEAVDKAGRSSEMGYVMMLKGLELRRDMEVDLTTNRAKTAGTAGSAARKYAGLPSWLVTNVQKGTGSAADPATADGAAIRTDGTQAVWSETKVKAVAQSIFTNGGSFTSLTAFVGPFNKAQSSGMTGIATPIRDVNKSNEIVGSVDVYASDFGNIKFVPNALQRDRDCFILATDMWKVCYLREWQVNDLAFTGGADQKQIEVEYTLQCNNEKASGGIFDLTTS